jgi:hypothetical protein
MKSIGIEFYENNTKNAGISKNISHYQFTVPSTTVLDDVPREIISNYGSKNIVHSNLLNTMGTNDWSTLSIIAEKNLVQYNNLSFIEHYTLFKDKENKKYGVKSNNEIEKHIQNINKWKSILNLKKLCLENVPVTDGADKYLNNLITVASETCSYITLDIPHLIISLSSINDDLIKSSLLNRFKKSDLVNHCHIAGLIIRGNEIFDGHNLENIDMVYSFYKNHFNHIDKVTIEQSYNTDPEKVCDTISRLQDDRNINRYVNNEFVSPTEDAINFDIRSCSSYHLPYRENSIYEKNSQYKLPKPLSFFNDIHPFLYHWETTMQLKQKSIKLFIQALIQNLKASIYFYRWISDHKIVISMKISGKDTNIEKLISINGNLNNLSKIQNGQLNISSESLSIEIEYLRSKEEECLIL